MSDSDAPHLVVILYQFWSFPNQILKIADVLCSYLNTHNCVIKSENKPPIQIPLLDYPSPPVFVIFSSKRWISSKFQWIIFAKVISYHFWSNRARTLLTSPFASKLLPLKAGRLSTLPQEHAFIPGQIR